MGTAEHISKTPAEISERLKAEWDRYAVPAIVPPPEGHPDAEQWTANERRRQAIAALRVMATFLEDHPRLPVPTSIHMQSSHWKGDRADLVSLVEAAAEEIDVAPEISDSTAVVRRFFGGQYSSFDYCVHAQLPEPTTAEVVSAALEG